MPGVENVAVVDTGVAVRAETFGQCIDAIRAMKVDWNAGPVAGLSDEDIVAELKARRAAAADAASCRTTRSAQSRSSRLPLLLPQQLRDGHQLRDRRRARGPRRDLGRPEVADHRAGADRRGDRAAAGRGQGARRCRAAGRSAAGCSSTARWRPRRSRKAMGKPVKLMWHRADDARVGRGHPMATSRVQALLRRQPGARVQPDPHQRRDRLPARPGRDDHRQRRRPADRARQPRLRRDGLRAHPGGALRLRGDRADAGRDRRPVQHRQHAQHLLARRPRCRRAGRRPARAEVRAWTRTSSAASTCATTGSSPCSTRSREVGDWGRPMPPGTAQGIAIHKEYKGASACLVEIDCRPADGRTRRSATASSGPRVTRVVFAIDVGLLINPRGLEAQMQGGINDGIALALTSSMHLRDGHFLEASWDNYFYTRQWNTPPEVEVIVMPETTGVARRCRGGRRRRQFRGRGLRLRPGDRRGADVLPDQPPRPAGVPAEAVRATDPAVAHQRAQADLLRRSAHAHADLHPQRQTVTVDVQDDVRVLWVLRDLLGVTGPKYGCGINVCKACTSHINGRAFNPCSVRVGDLQPDDEVTTIEGLPGHRRRRPAPDAAGLAGPRRRPVRLLPARPDHGRRRAGQEGPPRGPQDHRDRPRPIRNICRCGSYTRIREAIEQGARSM